MQLCHGEWRYAERHPLVSRENGAGLDKGVTVSVGSPVLALVLVFHRCGFFNCAMAMTSSSLGLGCPSVSSASAKTICLNGIRNRAAVVVVLQLSGIRSCSKLGRTYPMWSLHGP